MNTAIHYPEIQAPVLNRFDDVGVAVDQKIKTETNMTEVIIPNSNSSDHIIMPLVSSMTRQSSIANPRWLTWITHRKPSSEQMSQFNPDSKQLRIIHVNQNDDNRWIIWDALNRGNSHTVIADMKMVSVKELEIMEAAAREGNCAGIIIRAM